MNNSATVPTLFHCENVQDCSDGNACFPGTRADKVSDYSCSCISGYEEGSSTEYRHICNRKRCVVPVAVDKADHTPSSAAVSRRLSSTSVILATAWKEHLMETRSFTTTCEGRRTVVAAVLVDATVLNPSVVRQTT